MTRPSPALAGIRVVDFSRVLAGPFATQTLADLGAEVIKVENPHSPDQFRMRSPKVGEDSASFLSLNRNKRSVTVDMATAAGREVVLDLIGTADVLVENYTSRVMRGYGLDHGSISERFPRLIYCAISAYGRSGSMAEAPGYDPIIAAETGVNWLGGSADGPANLGGIPLVDVATAQNATSAILAALIARSRTGKGEFIEVSLYDTAIQCLSYLGYNALVSGKDTPRDGRRVALGGPSGYFETSDGYLIIIATTDRDFRSACAVIGAPELAAEEQNRTFAGRLANLPAINAVFAERLRAGQRDEWVRRFREGGVPAAAYLSIREALGSALAEERGMVTQIPHVGGAAIPNIASALRLTNAPLVPYVRAPGLGEDNHEILSGLLGYDDGRLDELARQGAFGSADPRQARRS